MDAVAFVGEFRRRGQKDDLRRVVKLADRARRGHAVDPRHHHVDDQQIESVPVHHVVGFARIGGGENPKSVFGQKLLQQFAQTRVVVDHQHQRRTQRFFLSRIHGVFPFIPDRGRCDGKTELRRCGRKRRRPTPPDRRSFGRRAGRGGSRARTAASFPPL